MPTAIKPPTARQRRRFADVFLARMLGWAKTGTTISCVASWSSQRRLVLYTFTRRQPTTYAENVGPDSVERAVARAKVIAPDADPEAGDWQVFDGMRLYVFRRYDEPWTAAEATRVAKEVAGAILMAQ